MDYYPTKIINLKEDLQEKIDSIFSYNIIFLTALNKRNVDVIKHCVCYICNHKLYYADCFHKRNELKVSFLRFCHYCKTMFVLTGRFESKEKFDVSFEYFDKYIYNKKEKRSKNEVNDLK